jgi:hypothetical protein
MEQQMMVRNTTIILQNLPALELPAGTAIPGNRIITNDPIPQNEFETGLRVTAEEQSLNRLNRNFARQMLRQGWKRDKQWAGDFSAGSSWTLQTVDDRELSALINIVKVTETDYELSLRLQELL